MKKRFFYICCLLFSLISISCANLFPAPIKDGSYLTYQLAQYNNLTGKKDYCRFTIKFTKVNNRYYEVTVGSPDRMSTETLFASNKKDGKVLVTQALRRRNGQELRLENIGPIWVSHIIRRKGGRESVDLVFFGVTTDKIMKWKKWNAYVVNASIFRGAISGTWYYDKNTGFLVGFKQKTAVMYDWEVPTYTLIETNIEGL